MDDTLAVFSDPDLDLASMLCLLVSDIRWYLIHPDMPNAHKLSAISRAVDELAPPPAPDTPAGSAAQQLARDLLTHTGPATKVLEQAIHQPITMRVTDARDRAVTAGEQDRFGVPPGELVHDRSGQMIVPDGTVISSTRLVYVPSVLAGVTPWALPRLEGGEPFGTILGDHLTRHGRVARPTGGDPAVISGAFLLVDGHPAGFAEELITEDGCALAGKAPGSTWG